MSWAGLIPVGRVFQKGNLFEETNCWYLVLAPLGQYIFSPRYPPGVAGNTHKPIQPGCSQIMSARLDRNDVWFQIRLSGLKFGMIHSSLTGWIHFPPYITEAAAYSISVPSWRSEVKTTGTWKRSYQRSLIFSLTSSGSGSMSNTRWGFK